MSDDLFSIVYLSVKTGLIAVLLNLPAALFISYLLERVITKHKEFLEGVINLPLVMPPVTIGYLLLLLLGKRGFPGSLIYDLTGFTFAYKWSAALIASMVVSFPLMMKSIRTSMAMVDSRLENAALTLGVKPLLVYLKITLPLIFPGLINGLFLGFARSLGEFGATMTFAGNISGETRTIPLAVYSSLQIPGKESEAALLVLISVLISFGAIFLSSFLNRRTVYGS